MLKSSGNILIVNEDAILLSEIRAQLVPQFNVFTASDSRTAFRTLREFDMHVVLASERLKDMTGLQFTESVRGSFPDLVTIVQARSADISLLKQAFKMDKIQQYLRFDADIDEISHAISSGLRQAQLQNDNRTLGVELKSKVEEQNRILELFKRYVPEQVVSQSLMQKHDIMQGETRIVSVLFADIRNFTRLAATLSPAEVVSFLNDFWAAVSEPVTRHRGSVNKLIGDGMLAVFGAPVSYIDNQENSVLCALDMLESLDDLNRKYSSIFGVDIKIGVGINTGEVVVGNVGTANHMEYTVIGDAVNVASRLESMTKSRPNSILISEATYDHVSYMIDAEPSTPLVMDGKDTAIATYEVIGRKDPKIKPMRRTLGY